MNLMPDFDRQQKDNCKIDETLVLVIFKRLMQFVTCIVTRNDLNSGASETTPLLICGGPQFCKKNLFFFDLRIKDELS